MIFVLLCLYLSYNNACVPFLWKRADVIPLPKSSPVVKNQIRPISLLPIVSKVYERVVLNHHFGTLMCGYDDEQFAYRKNSSTVCALVAVHEYVINFLEDTTIAGVRVIAFDMSRAFDSVPHQLLVSRISSLESPDSDFLSRWTRSYVCNRQQRVRIGDNLTSFSNVTSGVPQGSLLGPYLFAIFMSTFSTSDPRVRLVKYADDVTIIIPVYKSDVDDLSLVTEETRNFQLWCDSNHMTINSGKTKVMSINVTRSPFPSVPSLNNVTTLKILGLIFNDKLTWTNHFDVMLSRLSRRLYVLRVLKNLLPHDNQVEVFNAIIRSVIEYASPVFVNPGKVLDSRLIHLCIRAYRIIHGFENKNCPYCIMSDVVSRRKMLAQRFFMTILNDRTHLLHPLAPSFSDRSKRIILPYASTSRKINSFFFYC